MTSEVSFFTNCYEGDWRTLLKTDRLIKIIESCNYSFKHTGLIINNVIDKFEVSSIAQKYVDDGILDAFYFSDDYSEQVLDFFKIKRKSFVKDFCDGYWYSIAPLTAILLCRSPYILYLTCDCKINPTKENWIEQSIPLLNLAENLVVNPIWTFQPELAHKESTFENHIYYQGFGFSDQCFLIKKELFSNPIYNYHHPSSNRYPVYSGHSFERRVNSFMQIHQKKRIILKKVSYEHIKINDLKNDLKKSYFKTHLPVLSRKIKIKLQQIFGINIA